MRYRLYGLTVDSALPLPELAPADGDGPADVRIRVGPAPALPGARRIVIDEVATYHVADGSSIYIEPATDAQAPHIRLYLLGSAMGALLHQRGAIVLHANAICLGDGAVAFMGPSGSGKSTLAAWFAGQGHAILTDDVCVVEEVGGDLCAMPGIPRIRLFEHSAAMLGIAPTHEVVGFDDGWRKLVVPLPAMITPVRLAAVYLLDRASEGIVRVSESEAFQFLSENTYRGAFIDARTGSPRHFEQMLRLASRVPLFRASRPAALAEMEQANLVLRDHAADLVEGMRPNASA